MRSVAFVGGSKEPAGPAARLDGLPARRAFAARFGRTALRTLAWPARPFLFHPTTLGWALGASVLYWLSFFPANWGWLGWVALVPVLYLSVRPDRPPRLYASVWLAGLAFGVVALKWMRLASPAMYGAWIAVAVFVSFQFPLFVCAVRWMTLRGGVPLLLAAPASWVVLEYIRAHTWVGFAWYYLGHTQHDALALIQIADLVGAYGVSFLVMVGNVAVFELTRTWLARRRGEKLDPGAPRRLAVSIGVAAALLAATLGYGFWRLSQDDFAHGPRVSLVQGNVPQDTRNDPAGVTDVRKHYFALADRAAGAWPDLIVWPETSHPDYWIWVHPELKRQGKQASLDCAELALKTALRWQAPSLLGLVALDYHSAEFKERFNSAVLVDVTGREADRYDKHFRVPFGEYVPFKEWIPAMAKLVPYDYEYSIEIGRRRTVFTLPGPGWQAPNLAARVGGIGLTLAGAGGLPGLVGWNSIPATVAGPAPAYRFAVLICYEDTIPHFPAGFFRDAPAGQGPDFFVNISNDGWFKGSEEHEEHLVQARFRAIETRRAVVRAVNMGISAIVDGNGRIVALPGPSWGASKAIPEVLTAAVPIDHRESLYLLWGDAFAWLCAGVVGVGLLWSSFRRT